MHPNSPPSRGLGKGMFFIAWLIALSGLTWFFNDRLDEQANPNQNLVGSISESGARQIVLKRNRHNQYVLPGFINDMPVKFLVDTGATQISVPAGVADRLRLKRGFASTAMTANGPVKVYATSLDSLKIGNIVLRDVRGHVNPGMNDELILLGMSALKHLDLQQRNGVLILTQR